MVNDGGPAFPMYSVVDGVTDGMSLRDWLAGQAPVSIQDAMYIGGLGGMHTMQVDSDRPRVMDAWCKLRYEYADAMLKARGNG